MADNQFRKKPVVIEAMQFQRRNNGPVPYPDWFDDAVTRNDIVTHNTGKWHDPTQPAYCEIKTLEGVMRANEGDWIIQGVKGELYPCKPDIFSATYEDARAAPPVGDDGLPPLPPLPKCKMLVGTHLDSLHVLYTDNQVREVQREAYEAGRRAAVPAQTGTQPAGDSVANDRIFGSLLIVYAADLAAGGTGEDGYARIIAHLDTRRAAVSTASAPGGHFYTFSKPDGWINLLNPGQTWEAWTREQGPPTPRGWKVSGNCAPSSPVE